MSLFLFDLNGTLLDPGENAEGIQAAVRLAIIHMLAGEFRPLPDLAKAVGTQIPENMPPFPDVPRGLARLHENRHRLMVLTNTPTELAATQLRNAGLDGYFERVIGADSMGLYKPHRRVYTSVVLQAGANPAQSWLVAAHDWDIIGAKGVGLRTVFLDRGEADPVSARPDRTVGSLEALALTVQPAS